MRGGGHVERDLLRQRGGLVAGDAADLDHDADLAGGVDVGRQGALAGHDEAVGAADDDVLAGGGGDVGAGGLDRLTGGDLLGQQCGDVDRAGRVGRAGDVLGDLLRERDEVVVAGDEVGVAVDLDEDAALAVGGDERLDGALGRLAVGELADLVAELDAQQLDGLLDVAVGLLQRLLAVHHAGAGALTEGL